MGDPHIMHYIVIFVPTGDGKWRALFPDVPECEAHGFTINDATFAAANELTRCIQATGAEAPRPRNLSEIECDEDWLLRNCIDFSKAVVTMVPLGA